MNVIDIRARRKELGMRQSELARRASVSNTHLRKWERGLELPDQDAARRLADILCVAPEHLMHAQEAHAEVATPGEGYTTSRAGRGELTAPRLPFPKGVRSVLDLFCGAGGLSYGFEESGGFATKFGVDLLPDRIETFVANHQHATAIAGDLKAYSLQELRELVGTVDVVVGGPPCQGFSSIRPFRNLTEGDPRNSLAEHYVLAINSLRPNWFVLENVVGILTHQGGSRLTTILARLRSSGYSADWRVLNAALYGVPQYRERVVIVGNRINVPFIWPSPSHHIEYKSMAGHRPEVMSSEPLFCMDLRRPVTLMEAIDDLPPLAAGEEATKYACAPKNEYQRLMRKESKELTLHKATNHSDRMLTIIRHAGANLSALPKGMVTSGFSSCYSRLDADRPSTTLTVNFVHPASNRCIHPYQDRALTPREGARIQGFPDRFEFRGTSVQIVKQIGNAVPPLLGQRIAEAILESEVAAGMAPSWVTLTRRERLKGQRRNDQCAGGFDVLVRNPKQKAAGEDWLRSGPCRCMVVDPNRMTLGRDGQPEFVATCPPEAKPHVGKKGFAERLRQGKIRVTLDDGTTLWGSECWWIKLSDGE